MSKLRGAYSKATSTDLAVFLIMDGENVLCELQGHAAESVYRLVNEMDHEATRNVQLLAHDDTINDEQYHRLKQQCEETFGKGKFILLEGGLKHLGTIRMDTPC